MRFLYDFADVNLVEGELQLGLKKTKFQISGYRDPLGDLTSQVLYLIEHYGKKKEVYVSKLNRFLLENDNVAEVTWAGESRGHRWFLELNDDLTIRIRFETYKDYFYPETIEDKKTVQTVLPLKDFVAVLLGTLDELLNRYGFIGYKSYWAEYEFPISNYLLLKQFLQSDASLTKMEEMLEQLTHEANIKVSTLAEDVEIMNQAVDSQWVGESLEDC
ncbi:MAG: hypothetical protein ACKVTZ_12040 [Bacteroidia bacterium]